MGALETYLKSESENAFSFCPYSAYGGLRPRIARHMRAAAKLLLKRCRGENAFRWERRVMHRQAPRIIDL
jgi:hypothetical protein